MCHSFGDGYSAFIERQFLKNAHGSIPDDGFRARDDLRVLLHCFRPDVHAHHAIRDGLDHLVRGALFDFRSHDMVDREHQFILCRGEQLTRQVELVVLQQRFPDRPALRFQEGVGHGAANQQFVDDLREIENHLDLVGDFGAAKNSHARVRGIFGDHGEILQPLLH